MHSSTESGMARAPSRGARSGPVVALGKALIKPSSPGHRRPERAGWLGPSAGGAKLNALIVLSQFGYPAKLVTRLPDNPLGWLITRHARSYSVDIPAEWDQRSQAGIYFIECGARLGGRDSPAVHPHEVTAVTSQGATS